MTISINAFLLKLDSISSNLFLSSKRKCDICQLHDSLISIKAFQHQKNSVVVQLNHFLHDLAESLINNINSMAFFFSQDLSFFCEAWKAARRQIALIRNRIFKRQKICLTSSNLHVLHNVVACLTTIPERQYVKNDYNNVCRRNECE